MPKMNQNDKLLYLFIGTALAIISSVTTTIVTKEYEEYKNRKVLLYKISNTRDNFEKKVVGGKYRGEIRYKISYTGRETASFTIYFVLKDGYTILKSEYDSMPKQLIPDIKRVDKSEYRVTEFREAQEIDFAIKVEGDMPIYSNVVDLKISSEDANLLIKQRNCKYYIDKWNIQIIFILIAIIIALLGCNINYYTQKQRLKKKRIALTIKKGGS